MSLFEEVTSQHIDTNGKARVLNYDGKGVSLAVSPLPPLDLPEKKLSEVNLTNIDDALDFIKNNNLEVVEQDGDSKEKLIQGLWVRSLEQPKPIFFGYIPIEVPSSGENALPNIEYSRPEITDPIISGIDSEIENIRHNAKVADYLKEHSLYRWAQNPSDFGMNSYIIDDEHTYDIKGLSRKFEYNDVLYRGGYILVPDEETAQRLISYVETQYLNDSTILERYKSKKIIDGSLFYTSVTDFRSNRNQLVFIGKDSVLRWKMEKARYFANTNVYTQPRPYNREPYYYRNLTIKNGKLMIIQNTIEGDFPSALAVSKVWETSRVNIGYNPTDVYVPDKNLSFEVYTEEGKTHKSKTKPTQDNPRLRIFGYEDGSYAAVLFL